MSRKIRILVLLASFAVMESPLFAETAINVWLDKGDRLQAEVTLGGKRVGVIDKVSDHEGLGRVPFLTFDVPAKPGRIDLHGVVTIDGKEWPFEQSWQTVDMAELTGRLHAKGKTLSQRIADYCQMLKSMEKKYEDEFFGAVHSVEKRGGNAATMLAAAEARLGVKLPALEFFAEYELRLGDSNSVAPANWKTVEHTLQEWGSSGSFAKAERDRFARSIVVFVEVGDGLGLMAWDPQGVTAGEKSNAVGDKDGPGGLVGKPGEGVWFWLHQDDMESELLLDRNRRPRDTESAVMSAIERVGSVESDMDDLFDLGEFGDVSGEDLIWIDSSNPRGLLGLSFDTQDGTLAVSLRYLRYQFATLW